MPRPEALLLTATSLAGLAAGQGFAPVMAPLGIVNAPYGEGEFSNGVCVADLDGDGDVDVVVPSSAGAPFRVFRNDGGMQFTDVTLGCGLGDCGHVLAFAAADVDNDGDQDIYVGNEFEPAQLFVNTGAMVFVEQAAVRGLTHAGQACGATFGDFDRDGWLDLCVGNRANVPLVFGAPNILYRNTGGGVFVDVTATAGIGATNRGTFVVVFIDYDEDGWPDLLEANDKGTFGGPNELWRNNGDGTFTAVGAQVNANIAVDGMGVDFLDVFNDGGVDFYCSDVPPDHLFERWDPATGAYVVDTYTFGLQGGGLGWAVNFLDYDNDGWQDLHVVQSQAANLLFHNPGQPPASAVVWPNLAPALGVFHFSRQFSAVVADFDDDGRVDLLERFHAAPPSIQGPAGVLLERNTIANGNWLKVVTRGRVGNRDGIGARVVLDAGGRTQRQWVRSGVGFLSSSDRRLHFGLGSAATADLTITWPSGQVQHVTGVAANQIVEVVEPQMGLAAPAQVGLATALDVSVPSDAGLLYLMMLSFSDQNPVLLPNGTVVPIEFDALAVYTVEPGNAILPGSLGLLDAAGAASSPLIIPPLPWLAGTTIHGTAVTLDMPAFPLLRTVFPAAVPIAIQ